MAIGSTASCIFAWFWATSCVAGTWNVTAPPTSLVLDTSSVSVAEMSGVTYLGPSPESGKYRFAAVQNSGAKLITFDVGLSPTGALRSATAVSSASLALDLDFEGVAYTNQDRDSVYLADEGTPAVREFLLTTGAQLQNVALPAVFANRRENRGLESLSRSQDGKTMWTANEEALTVDGEPASGTAGTTVRLLRMHVSGDDVAAAEQYAYQVEKIHSTNTAGRPQSGLSDLATLPDGALLALERSVAVTLSQPIYQNRIYEVGLTDATNVAVPPFDTGLLGQSFTPVTKELLWAGAVDGASGQNMEGITLGPQLANGNWILLGVVDDSSGGDLLSRNTIVSFVLSATTSADFDDDGDVDGRDFLHWQRGFGKSNGANHHDGDADRDGDVDADDESTWQSARSETSPAEFFAVPEPATLALVSIAAVTWAFRYLYRWARRGESSRQNL